MGTATGWSPTVLWFGFEIVVVFGVARDARCRSPRSTSQEVNDKRGLEMSKRAGLVDGGSSERGELDARKEN